MRAELVGGVALEDNRELLWRLFTAVDSGAWDRMAELYTDDAAYHRPGFPAVVGRGRIVEFYEHERPIASGRHVLERVLVASDQGFCWGTFMGDLRTGEAVSEVFADWYRFDHGRIAERRTFFYRPAI